MIKNISIAILIVIVVILSLRNCGIHNVNKQLIHLNEVQHDSLVNYIDKDSQNVYKIAVFQTEKNNFINYQFKQDSIIEQLQSKVKKYKSLLGNGSSVTVIETITEYRDTTITEVLYDTVHLDTTFKMPIYRFSNSNKWISYSIESKHDTSIFDLVVHDNFSLVSVAYERQGLFKPKKAYSIIEVDNPYSSVKSMRTYNVDIKNPKTSIGVHGGYGIVLTPSGEFKHGFTFSVGVNYRIIQF